MDIASTLGNAALLVAAASLFRGFYSKGLHIHLHVSGKAEAPADPAADLTPAIALPQSVLDYCSDESEEFAQEECKSRARSKFANDNPNWEVVLTSLMREDGEIR